MKCNKLIGLVSVILLFTPLAHAELTSVRLGYAPNDKLLLVHADDIGMSHTVNRATLDLLKFGIVKSGSVMTPCPWVNGVKDIVKAIPNADLGVHATLTSEWKNYKWSSLTRAPGLSDWSGYFWPSLTESITHASSKEVEAELEAQIKFALSLAIKITHIDSHMGVYFARADYLNSVVKLSKQFNIPAMFIRWTPEFALEVNRHKLDGTHIKKITEEAEQRGAVLLDYLVTDVPGKTIRERKISYDKFLKNLKPGVTELIIHPGYLDDEMRGIMVESPEGLYRRAADYSYFSSHRTKSLIKKLGIKLIGWKDLQTIQ